jgi:hypothetical protein
MRRSKLLIFAALAVSALGVVGVDAASAADEGAPSILCLAAGCEHLEAIVTGGNVVSSTLKSKKSLESETIEATIKNCESFEGKTTDIRLCKDVPLELAGVKVSGTTNSCNTEGDPAGVVLSLIDLHVAALETTAKELQPMGLGKILNSTLEPEVKIKCAGGILILAKGTLGCAAPIGLKNITITEKIIVTCKAKGGDQELNGKCVVLCEWLETDPFLVNMGGGFEDAAKEFTISGQPNKDIFIDD